MDDQGASVTAHWMLGRLTVLQATAAHIQHNPELDAESRELLLARSLEVMGQLQTVIEDMARGLPSLSIDLHPLQMAV